MEGVWVGADFDKNTRTTIKLVIQGSGSGVHEFVSTFFFSKYGTDLFTWSADRLSGDPLVITSMADGVDLEDEPPQAQVEVACEFHGRPPFEDLISTSERIPELHFSLWIDHYMLEGTLEVKGGVIIDQSFIDWTERDDELTWIPGPDGPWKPRPPRED